MRDDSSYSPTGGPGHQHWQASTVVTADLTDRGGIFFAALQMTRMPMILTDPRLADNPIVFANKAFLDLTRYSEEEILGRNCRFLQGAETDRRVVDDLREAIAAERAISVELLNYRRDGTSFRNAVFIAPVHNEAGELIHFFASQLDVTRRHVSEQSLRQSQKMEAIGQLTAGLAHDFNNLLQVVAGNIEMVLEGELTDQQRRRLQNAARGAERGSKLTRQLLAFARKTRLEPRSIDLNELLGDFGEMMENAVGARVELVLELKRRLPLTQVDPVHLEMALLNILINARDAMPGGGAVTVATSVTTVGPDAADAANMAAGDYVTLTVRDRGQGMSRDVLDRAIEPFFTTKSKEKGTGLGLAMAHGFVQQSRGRLEIESTAGQGTDVRMLFPVAAEEPASYPTASSVRDQRGSETVLVVDDSDDVRQLAEEHLRSLGYHVLAADSGERALEILANHRGDVDLLFTDIVMPGGISGLELAERISAERPKLPVLITTGYNEDLVADIPRGKDLDVLGKPYRRTELADRVRAAIDTGPRTKGPERSDFGTAEG